mmetsp:Transcript_52593/g.125607  ORF Transcript_52593/g.125607 Transcript_52593/m.125607 type:complete len:388 (+) Transcript_52593:23-1186(+)
MQFPAATAPTLQRSWTCIGGGNNFSRGSFKAAARSVALDSRGFGAALPTLCLVGALSFSSSRRRWQHLSTGWPPRRHSTSLCRMSTAAAGSGTPAEPRVALSEATASVLSEAWRTDAELQRLTKRPESERLEYNDAEGTQLFGRVTWPPATVTAGPSAKSADKKYPGVLLLHTAAGPHDLFLHWRADSLAARGYVVLIADCFGDSAGLAWEGSWNQKAREPLRKGASRPLLRERLRAACSTLEQLESVDRSRLAAVGFCFGGMAALDCVRAGIGGDSLRAVVTFHGILDDAPLEVGGGDLSKGPRILVLNGAEDPFVGSDAVDAFSAQMTSAGARWTMQNYQFAKHGFSNPAQDLNENPAFGYDAEVAQESWDYAIQLLDEELAASS